MWKVLAFSLKYFSTAWSAKCAEFDEAIETRLQTSTSSSCKQNSSSSLQCFSCAYVLLSSLSPPSICHCCCADPFNMNIRRSARRYCWFRSKQTHSYQSQPVQSSSGPQIPQTGFHRCNSQCRLLSPPGWTECLFSGWCWHATALDGTPVGRTGRPSMNNFRTQTQDDWQLAHGEVVHAAGKTDKKWNAFTLLQN